ncbi:MAG TPA: glutamate racemase [Patescibacteria group bacterium]|nr:glutamate racemase [Patescibacteria group bacterium]
MTPNSPIGILDSGVGGLSVWEEINKLLPHERTLYIADSAHAPYGNKSEREIFALASKLVEFLLTHDVKIIVAACNTITVTCIDKLREKYPPTEIVGVVPAIKPAVAISRTKRIGILTTERTAKSDYQHKLIDDFAAECHAVTIGTNKLVPLIEAGEREGLRKALPSILEPLKREKIDTVVLGCTHYPLIRDLIEDELGKGVAIVDSGEAIARRTRELLQKKHLVSKTKNSQNSFFTTGSVKNSNLILQQVNKK